MSIETDPRLVAAAVDPWWNYVPDINSKCINCPVVCDLGDVVEFQRQKLVQLAEKEAVAKGADAETILLSRPYQIIGAFLNDRLDKLAEKTRVSPGPSRRWYGHRSCGLSPEEQKWLRDEFGRSLSPLGKAAMIEGDGGSACDVE